MMLSISQRGSAAASALIIKIFTKWHSWCSTAHYDCARIITDTCDASLNFGLDSLSTHIFVAHEKYQKSARAISSAVISVW